MIGSLGCLSVIQRKSIVVWEDTGFTQKIMELPNFTLIQKRKVEFSIHALGVFCGYLNETH